MQNKFKENILNIYGEQGKIWLLNLPNKLQEISMQFGLSKLTPFDNLSYNYVASGLRGAQPIKIWDGY
jgi:streptomycin 6-kinase